MKKSHAQRGASMVEFVIAATAFLMIIFGIFEFGRVLYIYHTVSNAARIGSRWAMVRGSSGCSVLDHCNASSSDIQTYVQSIVPIVDSNSLIVSASWSSSTAPDAACGAGGSNTTGHVVCVTVAYPFNFAVPIIPAPAPQPSSGPCGNSTPELCLSSTSRMVISQ
jgi:Flp pilus assembly protein TadG